MDSPASCRISVPGSTQVSDGRLQVFVYRAVTFFGRLSHTFLLTLSFVTPICLTLQPRPGKPDRFGLFPFRSPLLRELSLFLWVLRCFSSPGSLLCTYVFSAGYHWFAVVGFPIRKSPDITPVHGSPRLIAVSHVLLRHLAPRHSP